MLMLGLDAAGKTTLLYQMKLGEVITSIPTIGFNVETIQCSNLTLVVWDIGGQDRIRTLWQHYFDNTDALIFVIDASDTDRFEEARSELHGIVANPRMSQLKGVLVFATKMDLPYACDAEQIRSALDLSHLKVAYHLQPCSAKARFGLVDGVEALSNILHLRRLHR